jgi:Phage phiEco32-like COOH.NH2 ligase-type 2
MGLPSLSPHNQYTKTLGADPEVFIVDNKDAIIPAFKFLPSQAEAKNVEAKYRTDYRAWETEFQKFNADPNNRNRRFTKLAPQYKDTTNGAGGQTYWDGFQAEFTTSHWTCCDGGTYHMLMGLNDIHKKANATFPGASLTLKNTPYIPIVERRAATTEQLAFGCKPSFNAYKMGGRVPTDPFKLRHRFAGGHIHFSGFGSGSYAETGRFQEVVDREAYFAKYVKALDAILGIFWVGAAANVDKAERRKYYGLPGEFRTPSYGFEYRTLSNAWLAHSSIAYLTMGIARQVVAMVDEDMMKHWIVPGGERQIVETITDCDIDVAREILKLNEDVFKWVVVNGVLGMRYDKSGEAAMLVGLNGVESVLPYEPMNISKNWGLDVPFDRNSQKPWEVPHTPLAFKNWNLGAQDIIEHGKFQLRAPVVKPVLGYRY